MGKIIEFGGLFDEEADIYAMDRTELLEYLEQVRHQIQLLDEEEPEDMESEAYEAWGDRHEELEDLADEIMDCLENME